MDWQMVGAIGEILGAAGVIATLGYLATQVREAKRATQRRGVTETLDLNQEFLANLARDVAAARVWRLGMAADSSLTADELMSFSAMLYQITLVWERLYYLEREGLVETWMLEEQRNSRREIWGAPGFRLWFEHRGHWLSSEFRSLIENELPTTVEYRPLGVETPAPSEE